MSPADVDAAMLGRAVELALDNAAVGQLPFGALVVRDGTVLGTGVNTVLQDGDPVAHAEVAAVRDACLAVGAPRLEGATVFSSCEPCAMCHVVCASVGVVRVVYAAPKESVPDLGYPTPPGTVALLGGMRDALRAAAPGQVVHAATEGADEPFRRFLRGTDSAPPRRP